MLELGVQRAVVIQVLAELSPHFYVHGTPFADPNSMPSATDVPRLTLCIHNPRNFWQRDLGYFSLEAAIAFPKLLATSNRCLHSFPSVALGCLLVDADLVIVQLGPCLYLHLACTIRLFWGFSELSGNCART